MSWQAFIVKYFGLYLESRLHLFRVWGNSVSVDICAVSVFLFDLLTLCLQNVSDSLHACVFAVQTFLLCLFYVSSSIVVDLHGLQSALSRSYNSNNAPLSWAHLGGCREMHGSQGSLVFSGRDGGSYSALGFCVSTTQLRPPHPDSFTSFRRSGSVCSSSSEHHSPSLCPL